MEVWGFRERGGGGGGMVGRGLGLSGVWGCLS